MIFFLDDIFFLSSSIIINNTYGDPQPALMVSITELYKLAGGGGEKQKQKTPKIPKSNNLFNIPSQIVMLSYRNLQRAENYFRLVSIYTALQAFEFFHLDYISL